MMAFLSGEGNVSNKDKAPAGKNVYSCRPAAQNHQKIIGENPGLKLFMTNIFEKFMRFLLNSSSFARTSIKKYL